MDGIVEAVASPILVYPTNDISLWLDFWSNLASSLAWPAVTLTLVLLFRANILFAFKNLKSLKWGDKEANFQTTLNEAEVTAMSFDPVEVEVAERNKARLVELVDTAAISPVGAIISAWKDVDATARSLLAKAGVSNRYRAPTPSRLVSILAKSELLPQSELKMLDELRVLRNQAAHATDNEISVEQARRYVRLADRLVDFMNAFMEGLENFPDHEI